MGKTVAKIISAVALVASFFVAGVWAFSIGSMWVAGTYAFALQAVAAVSAAIGFRPDLDFGDGGRTLAENLNIYSSPTAVREVAFGRTGIAGQIVFRKNISNTGDTPDELLLILRLTGYPATSLEKFWFNGELVFDGESTTGPGAITTGTFADDLWVWFRTGEETTAAFPEIAALSSEWSAKTRKLLGLCCVGIRVKVTEKLEGRLEPLAQIKGAKLYDPRLDSTVPGGSGSHDFDDPATWAWSESPKLAELLYLRGGYVNGTLIFGMGKPKTAINLENFASEANICEEQIAVSAGGTIDRYTCNGLLIPQRDHRGNLQQLLSASAGTMDASEGIYHTFAGAWRASSMTLTESDIDGAPTEIQLQKNPSDEVNVISGTFADPIDRWQVKEYPELRDATSIAQVGENSVRLDLPFTNDHRIAQRIAKIEMKRLNAARIFGAKYWLEALKLQPGDIVTQTYARYGVSAETFRVHYWGLEPDQDSNGVARLLVQMNLVEEQEAWFDWDESTEEQATTSITSLPAMDRRPKLITLDGNPVFEGASPPANPKVGWLWKDTDVDIVYRWSGSAWVQYANVEGPSGDDGLSAFHATVYQRAASAPATPTADDGSYNFSTRTLTPPSGWSASVPANDGNPLYASTGIFQVQGTTGTDETVTWSAPQIVAQDGADGSDGSDGADGAAGLSVYYANVFRRSASAPATPTGGSYNFGTGVLTPPSSWSVSPPASDGNPLYVATATFSVQGTTGTDSSTTWTSPDLLVQDGADGSNGTPGSDGDDGLSVHVANVYRRSASAPATPTGGSYNFGTRVLTPPTSWSVEPPASDGNPLYVSTASFSVQGTTGTDSSTTWSSPDILVQDGEDGQDAAGIVKLAINYVDHVSGTLPQSAGVVFKSDGTVHAYNDGSTVQIGKWWSNAPETGIGSSYRVRCSAIVAGSWDFSAAAVGTFVTMSSDQTWRVLRTSMEGAGTDLCDADFEISPVSSSTIEDETLVNASAGS